MSFNPNRVIIARLTPEWSEDLATKKKAVGIRDRSLLPQARDWHCIHGKNSSRRQATCLESRMWFCKVRSAAVSFTYDGALMCHPSLLLVSPAPVTSLTASTVSVQLEEESGDMQGQMRTCFIFNFPLPHQVFYRFLLPFGELKCQESQLGGKKTSQLQRMGIFCCLTHQHSQIIRLTSNKKYLM